MTKKLYSKLLTCFLLTNFFGIYQLSFAFNNDNQNTGLPAAKINSTEITSHNNETIPQEKEPEENTKPGIISKIQDIKKINIKKTANKTFYYSAGAASATISAASLCGLIYLFKKLNEIKKSYIKNFIVGIATKITLYFEDKIQYEKYMLPGAIIGLSANAALTALMAAWMFRAGYKA